MPDEPRPTSSAHLSFAPPIDLRASLAPLGRSGDDLLDRWDGSTVIRTVRLADQDEPIAYAGVVSDSSVEPALELMLPTQRADQPAATLGAIRSTFLADRTALADLATRDEGVAGLAEQYPGLVPVLFAHPFAALVRSISAQQVNLRWAATVRRRLAERFGRRHSAGAFHAWTLDANRLATADVTDLRALQLTTAKAQSVIACAQAEVAGELRAADLARMDDEGLIVHLCGLRGIGRWSAEWFLARTLGRPRVVAGDLGVRKAVGRLYRLAYLPSELAVRRLTEHWGAAATHAQALTLHDLAVNPLGRPPAG